MKCFSAIRSLKIFVLTKRKWCVLVRGVTTFAPTMSCEQVPLPRNLAHKSCTRPNQTLCITNVCTFGLRDISLPVCLRRLPDEPGLESAGPESLKRVQSASLGSFQQTTFDDVLQRKIDELQARLNDKTIECAELRAKQRNGTVTSGVGGGGGGEPTGERRAASNCSRTRTRDAKAYSLRQKSVPSDCGVES